MLLLPLVGSSGRPTWVSSSSRKISAIYPFLPMWGVFPCVQTMSQAASSWDFYVRTDVHVCVCTRKLYEHRKFELFK